MNRFLLSIPLLVASLLTQAQDTKNQASEPSSTFEVNINGKKYTVAENEELKLDTLIKPTISIKLSDYKKFNSNAIAFEYPRHLSFEFDQDFGYKNWTLSGNNLVVLVFELDASATLNTLVNEMVKKFGKKNCTVEEITRELGNKKCAGQKLHVTLAGQSLVLECLEIKMNDFKSHYIYFQDSIENDQHSKEYEDGVKHINETITFK